MTGVRSPVGAPAPVEVDVALRAPVPIGLAAEIEQRVLFVAREIVGFSLIVDDGAVTGVTLRSAEPLDVAEITRKLDTVVDNDVRTQLVTPAKVVWRSARQRTVADGTYDRLRAAGVVSESGEGQAAIGEPLLGLMRYFDRTVTGILADHFDVREYRYPTLIATSTLEDAGYTDSFPHHLLFVTRLHNDMDVYAGVQETFAGRPIDGEILAYCGNVDYCLPPTMCYHTFAQHRGTTIGDGTLRVVTAKGKSFRFEAGYSTTLERLWDFTIREMVFMGGRDAVVAARALIMSHTFALLDDMGLTGRCEVGNDPFFGTVDTSDRIVAQRMLELKYELRLQVAPDRDIAVASFNFHDDLFGGGFGISHADGTPATSGCVGFGLERLVYAFVCQFGTDPADWPDAVRAGVRRLGA